MNYKESLFRIRNLVNLSLVAFALVGVGCSSAKAKSSEELENIIRQEGGELVDIVRCVFHVEDGAEVRTTPEIPLSAEEDNVPWTADDLSIINPFIVEGLPEADSTDVPVWYGFTQTDPYEVYYVNSTQVFPIGECNANPLKVTLVVIEGRNMPGFYDENKYPWEFIRVGVME